MKRWQLLLAATGVLLLIGWGLHKTGCWTWKQDESSPLQPIHVKNADAMDTSSGWRYRQNQPHHWRYIMLQN